MLGELGKGMNGISRGHAVSIRQTKAPLRRKAIDQIASTSQSGWRAILPRRWLPIVIDLVVVITLCCVDALLKVPGPSAFSYLSQFAGLFVIASVPVVVMAVAMTRSPIWLRMIVIFGFATIVLAVNCLMMHPRLPILPSISAALVDFKEGFHQQIRLFSRIALFAHLVSALLGAHVSAKTTEAQESSYRWRASIKDWLYFMTLVGLALVPDPKLFRVEPASILNTWFNDLFSDLFLYLLGFVIAVMIGIQVLGILTLAPLKAWRLRLAAVSVFVVGSVAFSVYFNHDPKDLLAPLSVFLMTTLYSLCSTPHWFVLRLSGYRLHLPQRSLEGAGTSH